MKSVSVLAVAALVAGVASMTINTPNDVSECEPTQFVWNGGQEPYYLSLEPGSDPTGAPLQQYGPLTGTTFTWPTNITQGTSISLTLKDSTGATAQSAPFSVNAGTTSCLSASGSSSAASGSSSSAAGTSSSAAASSSASASSSAAGTSSAASASSAGASSTASGSTAAASSTAPSGSGSSSAAPSTTGASGASSGAMSNIVNMAIVGLVGVAASVFLA